MQLLRSSKGQLLVGAVLALVAFVIVVVVLSKQSNNAATPVQPGTTPVVVQPTFTPTPSPHYVVAKYQVPPALKLDSIDEINQYFEDVPIPAQATPNPDEVTSIHDWITNYTHVYSDTTNMFLNDIEITRAITARSALLTTDYTVLPVPPPSSLAWNIPSGRVAETVQVSGLQSDNDDIQPGDSVDVLLSIRQNEVDSHTSDPQPAGGGAGGDLGTNWKGQLETQQLVSDARVIAIGLPPASPGASQTYTLAVPLQDALLLKYVKDTYGTVDLVLISGDDVKGQATQPKTQAVFPEYLRTPEAFAKGTPKGNGVVNVFVTPRPTFTPQAAVPAK
jgi:Flp pilus assembly protein CpaB